MKSMVVFFALAAVACGSLVPIAQPPHHPALVLDPHGRPLDTAEVINARALHLQAKALDGHHVSLSHSPVAHSVIAPLAHSIIAAPAAVSHQSRVDVHSSPAIISTHASPLLSHGLLGHSALGLAGHGHSSPAIISAHAAPLLSHGLLGHSALGLAGHGHYLKKRSLGHYAYTAPIIAPSAVSHQSRVDIVSSPAVVSHAVAAPVITHAIAPAAVSHQSRVDVHSSPAILSHSVLAAPVHSAHSILSAPIHGAHAGLSLSHGHLLKKRSLTWAPVAHAIAPSAVSHQSRVDVISSPAVVSHAVAAPIAVAHAAPLAHSAIWSAPASHLSHSALLHSLPLAHTAHW